MTIAEAGSEAISCEARSSETSALPIDYRVTAASSWTKMCAIILTMYRGLN